jgi:hypothetical protein
MGPDLIDDYLDDYIRKNICGRASACEHLREWLYRLQWTVMGAGTEKLFWRYPMRAVGLLWMLRTVGLNCVIRIGLIRIGGLRNRRENGCGCG